MTTGIRRCAMLAALVAGLSAGRVAAQEGTGNIYGSASDEQGGALPGVAATLTGLGAPQSTVTDAAGAFHFLHLAPATYAVVLDLQGFAKTNRENITVTAGRNTEVSVTMKLSSVTASVTVSDESPMIDSRKTETGFTFANSELQQVPTARDMWSVLQQVPSVQTDSLNVGGNQSGFQPNFIGKGSSQKTYSVDGVTITDNSANGDSPSYYDFDTFQELHIATGGSDLALQTPGVTINVVTKRGSNELHGSTRFFYAPQQWETQNTPSEASAQVNAVDTDRIRFIREFGAEIGGPILADRLWFWGAASRQDINLTRTGEEDVYGNPLHTLVTLEPVNAKLNGQISPSNSFTLLFSRSHKIEDGRGAGPNRPQETTTNEDFPTNLYKIEDSHVFSPGFFGSIFGSYLDERFNNVPEGGLNAQAFFDENGTAHNTWKYSRSRNPQHQISAQGSNFFDTGKISHELKFGFGYRHTVAESYSAWPGDEIFGSEYSSDTSYAAITRAASTKFEMNYYDAHVGDTLTAGNLTVNAGLRYDYQQARNLPSSVAANPVFPDVLPAVQYGGDPNFPITFRSLEPRVSATYALGTDRKTLLRASYSRFVDQLGSLVFNINGLPTPSGIYYYWNDANGDHIVQPGEVDFADGPQGFYHVDPTVAPQPANQIARNLKTPTTDEFILGLDHEIVPGFAGSIAYTYRYINHLQTSIPIGTNAGSYALVDYANGQAVASNGFTLNFNEPYYNLTGDVPSGVTFLNQPGAHQTYSGVELQLIKRMSNRWMARASFAYNNWRQHLSSDSILDPNNYLGGTNTNGGLVTEGGYNINSKWQFNVSGIYQLPWQVNFGANVFGRQGYSQGYYVQTRGPDGIRRSIQIGNVDSFRLANVYELDLRLEKAFKVGPVSLTASLDCFNVTNGNTVLLRDTQVGNYRNGNFTQSDTFDNILELESPRIFRGGLRVSF